VGSGGGGIGRLFWAQNTGVPSLEPKKEPLRSLNKHRGALVSEGELFDVAPTR